MSAALYERTVAVFDAVVRQVRADQWSLPTPCTEWTVHNLMNHVVAEDRWVPRLLAGVTIAEVGTQFDGDLLGDDAVASWKDASSAAIKAAESASADVKVGLSFGPTAAAEYLRQLAADQLIQAWDLAVATGQDLRFDERLAEAIGSWFVAMEDKYRQAGLVGARPVIEHDADPQRRLLAMFGRSATDDAFGVIDRFSAAFEARDVDAIMRHMTADCVFESTAPPDGERFAGQAAVRSAWVKLSPNQRRHASPPRAGSRAVTRLLSSGDTTGPADTRVTSEESTSSEPKTTWSPKRRPTSRVSLGGSASET
jgi:uncharacterized protein (TIGR03086 family)